MVSTKTVGGHMDLEHMGSGVEPLTITSNGRRYFDADHKRHVVEQCLAPGASVAAVSLAHGFNANLVRKWIRVHQAAQAEAMGRQRLIPVAVIEVDQPRPTSARKATKRQPKKTDCAPSDRTRAGLIEIQVGHATVRLHGIVEATTLHTVLQALGHTR
jgi:transposase